MYLAAIPGNVWSRLKGRKPVRKLIIAPVRGNQRLNQSGDSRNRINRKRIHSLI